MSKPWDNLRDMTKCPIGTGEWETSESACVWVTRLDRERGVGLQIDPLWDFGAASLRELAEFCNELADQLERE